MPKNCSKDVALVVDHVDSVLQHGSESEKSLLKESFGLGSLKSDADFAM